MFLPAGPGDARAGSMSGWRRPGGETTPRATRPFSGRCPRNAEGPSLTTLERSHYEVIGVAPGATTEEIHARYVAKVGMLDPSCHAGADPEVLVLARRAQERLHQAWETLKDASSRRCYDELLGQASEGHQEPEDALGRPPLSSPSWPNIPAPSGRLGALLAVPAAVADWLAPGPRRPRKVVVPEFLAMNVSQTSAIALRADVRL